MAFDTNKVINGTFGSVKVDGVTVAEAIGLEAKVTIEKEEVKQTGTLSKGYKVTGTEGKGTVKLNKVSSRFINLISDNLKDGKSTVCTIVSDLADPESDGVESIQLNGCIFDELTLIDWEAKKLTEESYAFTFADWEILSSIEPEEG